MPDSLLHAVRYFCRIMKCKSLYKKKLLCILRAQSFTSLKADLRQDINGGFAFSKCLNGILP